MAKSTSIQKITEIKRYGGDCFLVDSTNLIYAESERLAKEFNGYYMDQFTHAERASDWRGGNNITDSIFYDYYLTGDKLLINGKASLIEGIGRPRVEPSFIASVIDNMLCVSNKQSIAAMLWTASLLGRKVGGSTGTNMFGVLKLAQKMIEQGQTGAIVTLMCDRGERYTHSYYDKQWVASNIGDISLQQAEITHYFDNITNQ